MTAKLISLDGKPDTLGFFEAVALEGLEFQWFRLDYASQRRFFGKAIFGRKSIMVEPNGVVHTYRTCAFGRDWDEQTYVWNSFKGHWVYASDFSTVNRFE